MSSGDVHPPARKVTLHLVASLDGFIASHDNDVSWMEDTGLYEAGVTVSPDEVTAFLQTIDCYVMGARTYEHALQLGWPYGDTPVIVVTSRKWPETRKTIEFCSGDLRTLVDRNLVPRFRNIWLVGGAMLSRHFLSLGLVDEIRLTLAPVLLGDGLRLFGDSPAERKWNLKNVTAWRNGFVELQYVPLSHHP